MRRLLPRQRRPRLATVPVPVGVVEELRAAFLDWHTAPESQRGECKDGIVAVACALLDELPKEAQP